MLTDTVTQPPTQCIPCITVLSYLPYKHLGTRLWLHMTTFIDFQCFFLGLRKFSHQSRRSVNMEKDWYWLSNENLFFNQNWLLNLSLSILYFVPELVVDLCFFVEHD